VYLGINPAATACRDDGIILSGFMDNWNPTQTTLQEFEVPPPPPTAVFDAWFAANVGRNA
jgi:hypothetical protein